MLAPAKKCRPKRRCAFSLMEAVVAMSILAMAGSVLLLGVETSLRTTNQAVEQTIAAGLADCLIDEVLGQRYMDPAITDPYQYPFSPNSYEQAGPGRSRYNDTDDYHGYRAEPANDIWGKRLGTGDGAGGLRHANFRIPDSDFSRWRQEIDVYYVRESDPSQKLPAPQTSNLRCLEVRILYRDPDGTYRELAKRSRVFSYVPPPP